MVVQFREADSINVLISGLTAAGKTTHAKLLAENMNYEYISATALLAGLLGIPSEEINDQFWIKYGDQIDRIRRATDLDNELDHELLKLCLKRSDLIVDAWAAPWLVKTDKAVRVWLKSDLKSRTLKAAVSDDNAHELSWYEPFIDKKDRTTRNHFKRLYDFDLYMYDTAGFDVIIENTLYIKNPTRLDADRGIALFDPVFTKAVKQNLAYKK
ncbi:cytidylate kinase-like family protein [Arthrobacter dokdonensis]|uniref:cytidylate kinase-like family protein n=1 Tax=Arthrobacter dokdonellae TaxID=2211210 RepID=UPI001494DAC7|nr:cytidylate kinase family protein [Arthrobacter dokdonellae]